MNLSSSLLCPYCFEEKKYCSLSLEKGKIKTKLYEVRIDQKNNSKKFSFLKQSASSLSDIFILSCRICEYEQIIWNRKDLNNEINEMISLLDLQTDTLPSAILDEKATDEETTIKSNNKSKQLKLIRRPSSIYENQEELS